MSKILHYNTFYFLRFAHVRYVKSLFTNIQKQQNMLEIRAQIFSCKFCDISRNTFFKEPFGRLVLHEHSFCLLSRHDLSPFLKRCHTYFPIEYFLDLIYRLGARVSSIVQTLSQKPEVYFQPSRTSAIELFSRKQLTD